MQMLVNMRTLRASTDVAMVGICWEVVKQDLLSQPGGNGVCYPCVCFLGMEQIL